MIEAGDEEDNEELRARLAIARAALDRVDELEGEDWTLFGVPAARAHAVRVPPAALQVRAGKLDADEDIEDRSHALPARSCTSYGAQREALVGLRNRGEISTDVMRRVEREVDLEESRLEV